MKIAILPGAKGVLRRAPGLRRTRVCAEEGGTNMQWTTPSYTDIRLGFEITMYVATR
nr:pyrroloquinoline quinone precursor peptide PqqA [Trinickia violacea]